MIGVSKLKIGDKVHYQPEYYGDGHWENGMVKDINNDESVFVVYHCNNDWKNFKDYTGALTNLRDLKLGWK